jgi:protoporphyrinogen oxidase
MKTQSFECCILGAGPAGLATGIELVKNGARDFTLVDKNHRVGGLARTEQFDDYRFDVGPHRFFTSNKEINTLWHETLGDDFRPVDRTTRIYYDNRLYRYPLDVSNVLLNLGFWRSLQCLISFASSRFEPKEDPASFEDWIVQKFGRKLYEIFFKTYTEKVWGIPCSQISAEWAAQRIKKLDIVQLIKSAVSGGNVQKIKTLVEQFDYPVLGSGQMYDVMMQKLAGAGVSAHLGFRVTKIHQSDSKIRSIEIEDTHSGEHLEIRAQHYFSSIPITQFFNLMQPSPAQEVLAAAKSLYYREHITVDIVVDKEQLFPDQWIYVHAPEVRIARVANYNNFSKAMVDNRPKTALSAEYFVFQSDDLWKMPDKELIDLAVDELSTIKLMDKKSVEKAWVVRETESYPTYYLGYKEPYEILRKEMNSFSNVSPIGRGGMYKYNNQDHSALTGILAARNYLHPKEPQFDLWSVNIDAEYLENAERDQM